MGGLSVNINSDDSISTGDQSVEEGYLNYVHAALESNGYPPKFIQNIQAKKTRSSTTNVSPEELAGMFFLRWSNQPNHESLSLLSLTSKE